MRGEVVSDEAGDGDEGADDDAGETEDERERESDGENGEYFAGAGLREEEFLVENGLDFVGAEFDAGHQGVFGSGDDIFVVELFGGSGADENDFVFEGAGFEVAFDDIDEGNVSV